MRAGVCLLVICSSVLKVLGLWFQFFILPTSFKGDWRKEVISDLTRWAMFLQQMFWWSLRLILKPVLHQLWFDYVSRVLAKPKKKLSERNLWWIKAWQMQQKCNWMSCFYCVVVPVFQISDLYLSLELMNIAVASDWAGQVLARPLLEAHAHFEYMPEVVCFVCRAVSENGCHYRTNFTDKKVTLW